MKRLTTALAAATLAAMPGLAAAQTCAVYVGFEDRSVDLFEGQSATLTVTADFKGPVDDDFTLEVSYGTDPVPIWQQGQPNEGAVGSHGGASPSDYVSASGTLTLSKDSPSATIAVQANTDDESEADERFHVNLSIPYDASPQSTHRTREQACADPMSHFRPYGFFATVRIRNGAGFAPNHWLFGSGD